MQRSPTISRRLALMLMVGGACVIMVMVVPSSVTNAVRGTAGTVTQLNIKEASPSSAPRVYHGRCNVDAQQCSDVNSVPGSTGSGIPVAIRKLLNDRYGGVDENAQDYLGAEAAVKKLEAECGWNPTTSNFDIEDCFAKKLGFDAGASDKTAFYSTKHDIDIVIPTIRNLDFLNNWRHLLEGYHIILVQDGDPDKFLNIPDWVDYELYNHRDIEDALGADREWIISSRDASVRNFGFLVSRAKYMYSLDDDCSPPDDTANTLADHVWNLKTNSTPHVFNTLYDPYQPGSDFVRGYPYSLRKGVPTAVSHGIWLNAPDYDAPTQLLKVTERNKRFADVTVTVPSGILYPMCSMNVAVNRELIGPAFMQGLMGDGQPWARYDDMFAGWASKVVADHLGLGVKSGAPYIRHNKASNPFVNLKKEYKGLWWQEEAMMTFFNNVKLSPENNTPQLAYVELSHKMAEELGHLSTYFGRMSLAMRLWVEAWDDSQSDTIKFRPSRASYGSNPRRQLPPLSGNAATEAGQVVTPRPRPHASVAMLTVVKNEPVTLPLFIKYYSQHFHVNDIHVLDNDSTDHSTDNLDVHVEKFSSPEGKYFDHDFLVRTVKQKIEGLLAQGYKYVLFAEVDEFVVADPAIYAGGLREYLHMHVKKEGGVVRATGVNVRHDPEKERPYDGTKPIMSQRRFWSPEALYNKPVLTNTVLNYIPGFHDVVDVAYPVSPDLFLVHLKRLDYDAFMKKAAWKLKQNFKDDTFGETQHFEGDKLLQLYWQGETLDIPKRFRSPPVF